MYKLQLDRDLTKDFEGTPKEVRNWVVNAIANIVIVDGVVERHEFMALQEAIGFLESKDEVHKLMEKVKERKLDEVTPIKMKPDLAVKVFFYLAAIAIIDGKADQTLTVTDASNITVGAAITQTVDDKGIVISSKTSIGSTELLDGYFMGIVTGVNTTTKKVDVKFLSRVSTAGTETVEDYNNTYGINRFFNTTIGP